MLYHELISFGYLFLLREKCFSFVWTHLLLTRTKWRHAWRSTCYDFISKNFIIYNHNFFYLFVHCTSILRKRKKLNKKRCGSDVYNYVANKHTTDWNPRNWNKLMTVFKSLMYPILSTWNENKRKHPNQKI